MKIKKWKEALFRCAVCGFHYSSKEWSAQCEAWCRTHQSCNLEITSQSVIRHIRRIEYRRGMFTPPAKPETLPTTIWNISDIPEEVHQAIREEGILELEGVYGRKELGRQIKNLCYPLR